jgi:EmrB/QacA subfamily drug resistance transporter
MTDPDAPGGAPEAAAAESPVNAEMGESREPDTAPVPTAGQPRRDIVLILSGLMAGMFLAALDQTVVGTAIRTIADDLNGLSLQALAITAYLITATISTPIYAKLADIHGRKPLFVAAISIFVVGSLAAAFAEAMYQLAVFRAIQGLGAGGLMSLALTITADLVPAQQRARYRGYFMAVFGASSVLGPVLGGFFADQTEFIAVSGWRWVFLINVPIGIAALVLVGKELNLTHQRRNHRIDWWGAATLATALVSLLIVAGAGREWGWGSDGAIVCYVLGALGLMAFLLIETQMKDDALLPLRLFANATFRSSIVAGAVLGVGMFGGIVLVPQYLQIVQGYRPTEAGLMMLPMFVGIISGAVLSGQLTLRTGQYKILPIVGSGLSVVGLLLFSMVDVDTPLWQPLLFVAVFGFGIGNCLQTLTNAAQNAVSFADMGAATASSTFLRQLGGTVGVAVFFAVLFGTARDNIISAFAVAVRDPAFLSVVNDPAVVADPANRPFFAAMASNDADGVLSDSSFLQAIDPRLARPFQAGFAESIDLVFLIAAGVMAVAFLFSLFIRENPSRTPASVRPDAADEQASLVDSVVLHAEALAGQPEREDPVEFVEPDPISEFEVISESMVTMAEEADAVDHDAVALNAAEQPAGSVTVESELVSANMLVLAERNGHSWRAQPVVATSSAENKVAQRIGGNVGRVDGSPINGAVVSLIDQSGDQVARSGVDGFGNYHFDAPGPGTYVLIASANGYVPEASSIQVEMSPITVDITLAGAGELSGVVTAAATGQTISGATVTLADANGEVITSQQTTMDGRYRFVGVNAGSYTFVVSSMGYLPTALPLALTGTGEERQDVRLVGGVRLAGTAVNVKGWPICDAKVTVVDAAGNVVTTAMTDEEGRYEFIDLPEGDYTVIASGYAPTATRLALSGGEQTTHNVTLGYEEWK